MIDLTFLGGPDVERLAMTDDEILDAVEAGLRAQGLGQAVIEPRMHLTPDPTFEGHFNVLRGYLAPLGVAMDKVVVDDWGQSLTNRNATRATLTACSLSPGAR